MVKKTVTNKYKMCMKNSMILRVILSSNPYMGGIDTSVMMVWCCLHEWRSVKFWEKAPFNISGQMFQNSYILYKEYSILT
jgi:hypothetical protein